MTTQELPKSTPWGDIDYQREQADGLIWVGTPSHGGLWIRSDVRYDMPPELAWSSMHKEGWYEEDCDWALVCMAYPGLFGNEQCWDAVSTVRATANFSCTGDEWQRALEYLDSYHCERLRERARAFEEQIKDKWQAGSRGTLNREDKKVFPSGFWCVTFTHVGSGRHETVCCEYPEKRFYSDTELAYLMSRQSIARSKYLKENPPEKHASGFPQHSVIRGNSYVLEPSDADPGL